MMLKASVVACLLVTLAAAASDSMNSMSSMTSGSQGRGTPAPGTPESESAGSVHESSVEGSTATAAPGSAQPSGTPVPPEGGYRAVTCPFTTNTDGETASLRDYALTDAVEVKPAGSDDVFMVSPCGRFNTCNKMAFVSRNNTDNTDCTVYNRAHSDVPITSVTGVAYSFEYTIDGDANKGLITVNFICSESTSAKFDDVKGNLLNISTPTVCPEKPQADIPVGDSCSVDFSRKGNYYKADISTFSRATDLQINGKKADINVCGGKKSYKGAEGLNNCPDTLGYMAYNNKDGNCVVLQERTAFYNPNLQFFNTTFFTNGKATARSPLLGADDNTDTKTTKTVLVRCGTEDNTEAEESADGKTITYYRKDACAEKTAAPAAPEEKSGLSTGAIVGIIIGALALIVIILVICRWQTTKKDEETGEYERV